MNKFSLWVKMYIYYINTKECIWTCPLYFSLIRRTKFSQERKMSFLSQIVENKIFVEKMWFFLYFVLVVYFSYETCRRTIVCMQNRRGITSIYIFVLVLVNSSDVFFVSRRYFQWYSRLVCPWSSIRWVARVIHSNYTN